MKFEKLQAASFQLRCTLSRIDEYLRPPTVVKQRISECVHILKGGRMSGILTRLSAAKFLQPKKQGASGGAPPPPHTHTHSLLQGSFCVTNKKNDINPQRMESKPGMLRRSRLEQQNTSFLSVKKKEIRNVVSTVLSSYSTYFSNLFITCSLHLTY